MTRIIRLLSGSSLKKLMCWTGIFLLTLEFWVPANWLASLHLAGHHLQVLLCVGVFIGLVQTYGYEARPDRLEHYGRQYPHAIIDWNRITRNILRLSLTFLCFAAFLEIGQDYFGRHASMFDFLVNSVAVAAVTAALLPLRRWLGRSVS
jgi:uncharacterized membrane protein YedE/YeeE